MRQMSFETTSEAYIGILKEVRDNPEYITSPRDMDIREITDFMFEVKNPSMDPIITADPIRNNKIKEYYEKERELYASCSNTVQDFADASPFWKKLANPDGTINSAYGYLIWKNRSLGNMKFDPEHGMLTPWEWAKQSLLNDKNTRQAHIKFSLPEHLWIANKDQTCTLHGNFQIRNDKLNLTMVMRSNDVVLGLVFDAPWFISLIYKMKIELENDYKDLSVGTYTHFAHSMHMYERDLDKVNKMIGDM